MGTASRRRSTELHIIIEDDPTVTAESFRCSCFLTVQRMPLLLSILLFFQSFHGARSTFSPSGSISIDCGGQQTFTCTVDASGPAAWTITGLPGITASTTNGVAAGISNARITSGETVPGLTSTLTITGFTTADNGGIVQCVDQAVAEEGIATVVVVSTTLASATAVMANVDQCSATLTWSEPSHSSATTSVSCTPSSPQCSSCTSSGCTIGGLNPSTPYTFSVTRSRSGCDDSTAVSRAVMSEAPVSCPANVVATALPVSDAVTVTWSLPPTSPPVTSTTVTYCPTSSPNCGDSQVCTSPCTVTNLEPDTEYNFTVTATTSSNCGIRSCNGTTITAETACPVCSASATPAILSGVVPSVVLILINIISVVVAVLVTRHCYKKSAKGDSSSRREELYEQVEGKKVYEDVNMTDSPAYGPVI